MKNIALLFNCIFFNFFVFPICSQESEKKIQFSVETGLEYSAGNSEELVYRSSSNKDFLSRLQWDVPPSLGIRLQLSQRFDWFILRESGCFLWTLTKGIMLDDDWEIPDTDENPARFRIHSQSLVECLLNWEAALELGAGFDFSAMRFEFLVGGVFQQKYFEAWSLKGYDIIKKGSEVIEKDPELYKDKKVIIYNERFFVPYIHSNFSVRVNAWRGQIGIRFSPYVFAYTVDEHLLRDRTFVDDMRWGYMLQFECTQELWLNQLHALLVQLRLTNIDRVRGNAFSDIKAKRGARNVAGMSWQAVNIGLGYKFSF